MKRPVTNDKLQLIKEALYRGRKIEAIKIYRKCTGVDLIEAKRDVEELEEELKTTAPHNFMPATERRGCLGVIAVAFILGGVIWAWMTR